MVCRLVFLLFEIWGLMVVMGGVWCPEDVVSDCGGARQVQEEFQSSSQTPLAPCRDLAALKGKLKVVFCDLEG